MDHRKWLEITKHPWKSTGGLEVQEALKVQSPRWFNSWPNLIPDRWVGHLYSLWVRVTWTHHPKKVTFAELPGILYHLESRWHNCHVLVYHAPLLFATFWEWRSPSNYFHYGVGEKWPHSTGKRLGKYSNTHMLHVCFIWAAFTIIHHEFVQPNVGKYSIYIYIHIWSNYLGYIEHEGFGRLGGENWCDDIRRAEPEVDMKNFNFSILITLNSLKLKIGKQRSRYKQAVFLI